MKQYDTFIFDSFELDPDRGQISLTYSLDDEIVFVETIKLPLGIDFNTVPQSLVERAVFALHIVGGTSYYKTCCPKKMEVRSGTLTKDQAAFFTTVYEKGLAEFLYRNEIDSKGLINFEANSTEQPEPMEWKPKNNTTLVPIGGGKDSTVTAELLKKNGFDLTLFRMGFHPHIEKIADEIGLPLISAERTLSPKVFELNEEGALNGHIPITAYVSCLTAVMALLYGFENIVMSNERSASEGNALDVNHQWSKSLEFETMFQNYMKQFITPEISSFSLLRHLSELSVVRYFHELEGHHMLATSCNANWRIVRERPTERWCRTCPKCAFVFACYAAFFEREKLSAIFGDILFDDTDLLTTYRELLGLTGIKPFECVGTPDETKAALLLAHRRGDLDDTAMMKMFVDEVLPTIDDPDALIDSVLAPGSKHHIPEKFLSVLHAHS